MWYVRVYIDKKRYQISPEGPVWSMYNVCAPALSMIFCHAT